MLAAKFIAQLLFGVFALLQVGHAILPHEHIDEADRHRQEAQTDGGRAHRERPTSRVTRIQRPQFVHHAHLAPPAARNGRLAPSASGASDAVICWASSTKLLPAVSLLVWTTSSSGSRSHCEAEMLRISADTRVEDCATPSSFSLVPLCLTEVR